MDAAEPRVHTTREWAVPLTRQAAVVVGLAVALAVAGQVRIPLPFTPVPITLQTFVLYVGAAWMAPRLAVAGIGLYVSAALLGAPVMSGWRGGLAAFTGATGGYILGWFLAALWIGLFLQRAASWGRRVGVFAVASAVILFCGALHLALLLGLGPGAAFVMGVAPFLPGDALKVVAAATLCRRWPDPLSSR